MNELIYVTLWLIGASFLAIHTVLRKGGIMSSAFTVAIFVTLYFPSTNVLVPTDSGLLTTSNPLAQWLALFGAFLSTIVLFFSIWGAWKEEQETDERDMVATDRPDINQLVGGKQ